MDKQNLILVTANPYSQPFLGDLDQHGGALAYPT